MTVTRIEQINRSRYRIYTDDHPLCVLYKSELARYNISEGDELSDDIYEQIRSEILIKRARLRAMNLLMKHAFTEYKLRSKLRDGGYSEDIVDDTIAYVASFGYLDDRSFARDYIVSHSADKSIRRIQYDLACKGVSKDIINDVLTELEGTADMVDEEEQIRKLLKKRHFDPFSADEARIRKEYNYLINRGFTMDKIRRVLRDIDDDRLYFD